VSGRPATIRCAVYTRKSTEHNLDLEFNSLHAQREACEAYIKSQIHEAGSSSRTPMTTAGYRVDRWTGRTFSASWPISVPAGWTRWWSTRSIG